MEAPAADLPEYDDNAASNDSDASYPDINEVLKRSERCLCESHLLA